MHIYIYTIYTCVIVCVDCIKQILQCNYPDPESFHPKIAREWQPRGRGAALGLQ